MLRIVHWLLPMCLITGTLAFLHSRSLPVVPCRQVEVVDVVDREKKHLVWVNSTGQCCDCHQRPDGRWKWQQ